MLFLVLERRVGVRAAAGNQGAHVELPAGQLVARREPCLGCEDRADFRAVPLFNRELATIFGCGCGPGPIIVIRRADELRCELDALLGLDFELQGFCLGVKADIPEHHAAGGIKLTPADRLDQRVGVELVSPHDDPTAAGSRSLAGVVVVAVIGPQTEQRRAFEAINPQRIGDVPEQLQAGPRFVPQLIDSGMTVEDLKVALRSNKGEVLRRHRPAEIRMVQMNENLAAAPLGLIRHSPHVVGDRLADGLAAGWRNHLLQVGGIQMNR